MANGGLGSIWTRLLQEVDYRIAKALANIGAVGTTINAGNLAGTVNPTVLQVERLGPVVVTASENLAAGDMVDLWNDGGTVKARKANASTGLGADGFVIVAVTSGNPARVFQGGLNDAVSGLSPGQTLYLSATAGGVTTAAPTTSGALVQEVGVAASATSMVFQPQISILLA